MAERVAGVAANPLPSLAASLPGAITQAGLILRCE
jgi:hypothetical protein